MSQKKEEKNYVGQGKDMVRDWYNFLNKCAKPDKKGKRGVRLTRRVHEDPHCLFRRIRRDGPHRVLYKAHFYSDQQHHHRRRIDKDISASRSKSLETPRSISFFYRPAHHLIHPTC